MEGRTATLLTTINSPLSKGVKSLKQWAHDVNSLFIIVGEHKTPHLDTTDGSLIFVSLEEQLNISRHLYKHYLLTIIREKILVMWSLISKMFKYYLRPMMTIAQLKIFWKTNLWPRGLPISHVYEDVAEIGEICASTKLSLVEYMVLGHDSEQSFGAFQSLVDGDPDLDAIGKMLFPG